MLQKTFLILMLIPMLLFTQPDSRKGDKQFGLMFGGYTSNGLLYTYYPIDNLGYRISGYAIDDGNYYELKASTLYTLHSSKEATFYLIGSYFISTLFDNFASDSSCDCGYYDECSCNDNDGLDVKGFSLGAGYRFRGDQWGIFIEVQQNLLYIEDHIDYFLTLPGLALGFYFEL